VDPLAGEADILGSRDNLVPVRNEVCARSRLADLASVLNSIVLVGEAALGFAPVVSEGSLWHCVAGGRKHRSLAREGNVRTLMLIGIMVAALQSSPSHARASRECMRLPEGLFRLPRPIHDEGFPSVQRS